MWHASLALHDRRTGRPVRAIGLEHYARAGRALRGVGDSELEWFEVGATALHLRRRLTADEWKAADRITPWGIDLRHTEQGRIRLAAAGISATFDPGGEW